MCYLKILRYSNVIIICTGQKTATLHALHLMNKLLVMIYSSSWSEKLKYLQLIRFTSKQFL